MKKKPSKFVEPETQEIKMAEMIETGVLTALNVFGLTRGPVACRIIREKDYQRLLRAARGKGR